MQVSTHLSYYLVDCLLIEMSGDRRLYCRCRHTWVITLWIVYWLKWVVIVGCNAGVDTPELLPCGYLVGDSTNIAISLKGVNINNVANVVFVVFLSKFSWVIQSVICLADDSKCEKSLHWYINGYWYECTYSTLLAFAAFLHKWISSVPSMRYTTSSKVLLGQYLRHFWIFYTNMPLFVPDHQCHSPEDWWFFDAKIINTWN